MTTQTPTPTDNERIAHLEGVVEQVVVRLDGIDRRLDGVEKSVDNLRSLLITLLFAGFGLMWATMVGGFIAILTFSS